MEVFERRNLAAHGNMIVNDIYCANCKEAEVKNIEEIRIGDELTIDAGYLYKSIDILTEFGVMLIVVLWQKHVRDAKELSIIQLNDFAVELIQKNRYKLAKKLLKFGLQLRNAGAADRFIKMMTVNLANAFKKDGDSESCKSTIGSTDWSATGDGFRFCIASLEDDVGKVVELMPRVFATGEVTSASFREWPVLDWVRNDPLVLECFERVYGEPLARPVEGSSKLEEATLIEAETEPAEPKNDN